MFPLNYNGIEMQSLWYWHLIATNHLPLLSNAVYLHIPWHTNEAQTWKAFAVQKPNKMCIRDSTSWGHLRFACQMVSAVATPKRLASSFFAKIIPWRFSGSPQTAIGTCRSSGRCTHSTDAKNPLQSQCKIVRSAMFTSQKKNRDTDSANWFCGIYRHPCDCLCIQMQ